MLSCICPGNLELPLFTHTNIKKLMKNDTRICSERISPHDNVNFKTIIELTVKLCHRDVKFSAPM